MPDILLHLDLVLPVDILFVLWVLPVIVTHLLVKVMYHLLVLVLSLLGLLPVYLLQVLERVCVCVGEGKEGGVCE